MAWSVWGIPYETSEMSDTTRSQKVKFNQNIVLKGCRVWVVVYNNPSLTSLNMKIYSDDNGTARKLLHTSTNSQSKASILTLENGIKEIYFDFNYPAFNANDYYHFVLNGTGYTGTASGAHIAWRQSWPDPVYGTGLTPTLVNLNTFPFDIYFIGSVLA